MKEEDEEAGDVLEQFESAQNSQEHDEDVDIKKEVIKVCFSVLFWTIVLQRILIKTIMIIILIHQGENCVIKHL